MKPDPESRRPSKPFPFAVVGFLLPNFGGFLLFTLFPVALSLGMAFTNWSLRPAVHLEFVGLRNFLDLLGVRARAESLPALCTAYVFSVLLLLAGMVAAIWSLILRRNGLRPCGWCFVGLALAVTALAAWHGARHGVFIAAAISAGFGVVCMRADPGEGRVRFGVAVVPASAVILATVGLYALHRPMWAAYEPRDARFWQYLYNTFYLMLALPLTVAGSLGLALLLNDPLALAERRRGMGVLICVAGGAVSLLALWGLGWRDAGVLGATLWLIAALGVGFDAVSFRTIFYLPSFTSGVALMILWKALYNPQTGLVNMILGALSGLPPARLPQWLSSIALAKPALMVMGVWTGIGGTSMLLYLAALSNISPDLLEAAHVDGASPWQRFVHIVWPQVLPTTFFIGITSVIGGLQGGFEQARVMTAGGPAGSTTTLSYYIYTLGFEDLNFGYAAALSWVLFGVLFALTITNWRFGQDLDV